MTAAEHKEDCCNSTNPLPVYRVQWTDLPKVPCWAEADFQQDQGHSGSHCQRSRSSNSLLPTRKYLLYMNKLQVALEHDRTCSRVLQALVQISPSQGKSYFPIPGTHKVRRTPASGRIHTSPASWVFWALAIGGSSPLRGQTGTLPCAAQWPFQLGAKGLLLPPRPTRQGATSRSHGARLWGQGTTSLRRGRKRISISYRTGCRLRHGELSGKTMAPSSLSSRSRQAMFGDAEAQPVKSPQPRQQSASTPGAGQRLAM